MPQHPATVTIDKFKGLNNKASPQKTPQDYFKIIENLDTADGSELRVRPGYTMIASGNYHSLFSYGNVCLVVKDDMLYHYINNLFIELAYVGPDLLSYCVINNEIYIMSPSYKAIYGFNGLRSFGVEHVNPLPNLTEATGGMLKHGRYQVAVTALGSSGLESGVATTSCIDVQNDSAKIVVTGLQAPTGAVAIRLYVSECDGTTLYLYKTLTASQAVIDITLNLTQPLETEGLYPPPYGELIRYFRGKSLVVDKNIIWISKEYQYETFDMDIDFLQFHTNVVDIVPMESGIFVGLEDGTLSFLSGLNMKESGIFLKEYYLIVRNSAQQIPASHLILQGLPPGARHLILTDKGIVALLEQGIVINMTDTNVLFPEGTKGASVFISNRGLDKYVVTLQQQEDNNEFAPTDLVTCELIRNGVRI
jgi:hypothetical protein